MAVYICRRCNYEQPEPWESPCPSCKGLYRARKIGVETTEQKTRSTLAAAEHVKIPYVPTGIVGFDKTIGGGIVAGKIILLGGFRGAGKSTLLVLIADAVAQVKGSALYASSEEGVDGVLSIAHRVNIKNPNVEVLGNQQNIESVIEHQRKTKPFLAIYDSLQKFSSVNSGGTTGSISQEAAVSKAILDYHREAKTCGIVVNQMSKSGEMKGSTDAAHAFDAVLVLAYPRDEDEDRPRNMPNLRILSVDGKNRLGPDNIKTYWNMHGEGDPRPGMLEHVPARSPDEEPPKKRRYSKN